MTVPSGPVQLTIVPSVVAEILTSEISQVSIPVTSAIAVVCSEAAIIFAGVSLIHPLSPCIITIYTPGTLITGFSSSDANPPGPVQPRNVPSLAVNCNLVVESLLQLNTSFLTLTCGEIKSSIISTDSDTEHPFAEVTVISYVPGKSTTGFNSSDLNPPGPLHSNVAASVVALSINIVSLLHVSASSFTTNVGNVSSNMTVIDADVLQPAAFITVTVYSPS